MEGGCYTKATSSSSLLPNIYFSLITNNMFSQCKVIKLYHVKILVAEGSRATELEKHIK